MTDSVDKKDLTLTENCLGLGILDTLQKNMSVHVAMDLIGRFLLSYIFNKNPDLINADRYLTWDFAQEKTEDGEEPDSSSYKISCIPVIALTGGRTYPMSVLNQTTSLAFKALISEIKEAVEKCLTAKPVSGTVRLIVNLSDKGNLLLTLMYIHKEV